MFSKKKNNRDVRIEISTEYITVHSNLSSSYGEIRELIHAEPVITHVYPPNSNWSNTSGFRKYVSDTIGGGKNGDVSSPLDFRMINKRWMRYSNQHEKSLL